jgi:uncharacterized repeat protein (TIGR04076 family)
MKKCKITVLKRSLHEDLAKEYCKSSAGLCPCFKEGDTFIAGFEQPQNFCGWAWNDIYRFVSVLMSGGNYSKGVFEDWMKKENEMIACCTDAIRPVIFKIELIEVE